MATKLLAGWSEVDLTPEKKVYLRGQFCERVSEYVETPICATALAIDTGDDCAIMVSCDLESVAENLMRGIREELKKLIPDFDTGKLIVGATHTHTSMDYKSVSESGGGSSGLSVLKRYKPENVKYEDPIPAGDDVISDEEALQHLMKKIAQAAAEAWKNRKAAKYANEFGRAAVGMCRRAKYDDKSAQMWGDTNTANFVALEGGSDTGLEMIYFFDEAGKLTGVLANYACPAQCVQHRMFVSSDYWGKAKSILREKFGKDFFLLPFCAPAGDQCPVDLIRWVEPDSDVHDPNIKRNNPPRRKADPSMFDIQGSWKAGRRIANEIVDAYEEAVQEMRDVTSLTHQVKTMTLPIRRVTMKERDDAERALKEFFAGCAGKTLSFFDNASMHVHAGTLARFDFQQKHHTFSFETHYMRMDDMAFATDPFELFLDYGNQIRAQSPAEQTFLFQLTNGSLGYLPTERAEEGSHYSAYVSSGVTGHEGGEMLVRETLDTFSEMFKG
ncbi:MAG: hypothetical protein MJ118_07685 [Clostridia bacterium]|nr:hypothetical protein [Clostridia bacterium]